MKLKLKNDIDKINVEKILKEINNKEFTSGIEKRNMYMDYLLFNDEYKILTPSTVSLFDTNYISTLKYLNLVLSFKHKVNSLKFYCMNTNEWQDLIFGRIDSNTIYINILDSYLFFEFYKPLLRTFVKREYVKLTCDKGDNLLSFYNISHLLPIYKPILNEFSYELKFKKDYQDAYRWDYEKEEWEKINDNTLLV